MSSLYLTSVFHGNLLSSTIPAAQYSRVLDRCYWPVLELLQKHDGIKIGIEFPVRSLEIISDIDHAFIETITKLAKLGKLEFVGSGYTQAIQPLLPAELNRANILEGNRLYEEILGTRPVVAYLNEQVISQSSYKLYDEGGYRGLVMDYDNCKLAGEYRAEDKYKSPLMAGSSRHIVWNSAIAFQRFQRYIYGLIDLESYIAYLSEQLGPQDRYVMYYGSDWEIFDYKPGDIDLFYTSGQDEIKRLEELFLSLIDNKSFVMATPSDILNKFAVNEEVIVASGAHPLPCKKQAGYNVVRWAVCGRDNSKNNTQCYNLYKMLKKDSYKTGEPATSDDTLRLLNLFSSDYRTFTTEEKYQRFIEDLSNFKNDVEQRQPSVLSGTDSMELYNPHPFNWDSYPVSKEITFEMGQYHNPPAVMMGNREVPAQFEEVQRYRDGSIRSALLVMAPDIPAKSKAALTFSGAEEFSPYIPDNRAQVEMSLDLLKGGTIKELVFPGIDPGMAAGGIPHHYFNDIRVSTDQFTGHILLYTRDGQKVVDLSEPVEVIEEHNASPVRDVIKIKINTPLGTLWKTYYIYRHHPRVDLKYHFRFSDLEPLSFRLGTVTFDPQYFDKQNTFYASVNGTKAVESFTLGKEDFNHGAPVSLDVSAHYCLGATEGWISVGDNKKGMAVIVDKARHYAVPLIEYRDISGKPYIRLYHSIAESDATSQPFWRGHNQITFTYLGHKNDLELVRRHSAAISEGLVVN